MSWTHEEVNAALAKIAQYATDTLPDGISILIIGRLPARPGATAIVHTTNAGDDAQEMAWHWLALQSGEVPVISEDRGESILTRGDKAKGH